MFDDLIANHLAGAMYFIAFGGFWVLEKSAKSYFYLLLAYLVGLTIGGLR